MRPGCSASARGAQRGGKSVLEQNKSSGSGAGRGALRPLPLLSVHRGTSGLQKREKNDRLKRIANRPKIEGKRDMKRKAKARALILAAVLGSAVLLGGCARQTAPQIR